MKNRVIAIVLAMVLALGGLMSPVNAHAEENSLAPAMNVNTPSRRDIINYVKSHSTAISGYDPYNYFCDYNYYTEQPNFSSPYSTGKLKQDVLTAAQNNVNQMRYIAGLTREVTFLDEYNDAAQASAYVNYMNGVMTHYPEKPRSDMSDELYQKAYDASSHSNISWGTPGVSAINLFMSDSDPSNIDRVGHRRWILLPGLMYSGFGYVEKYTALHVINDRDWNLSQYGVAWPAQNTPLQYFSASDAWSISFGRTVSSDVTVSLRDNSTGKTWNWNQYQNDGEFYVSNDGYGEVGCVIFRPTGISINNGSSFTVSINNIGIVGRQQSLTYTVNFFDLNGKEGFYQIGGNWYYYDFNKAITGWKLYNNNWYYFASSGVMQTGWQRIDGSWYYFNRDGAMQTGWQLIDGKWYCLASNGKMRTGWISYNNQWYYLNASGAMQTGWALDNGSWYYMNSNGVMQTGWIWDNNKMYFMNSSGKMQTGWILYDGLWYYMNSSGVMQRGWVQDNGDWYYMNGSGVMQKGWICYNGFWYYLNESGRMMTNWICVNNTWYCMNSSGVMQTSRWIDNTYYVEDTGAMAVSKWVDGGRYYVDENGRWVPGAVK